MERAGVTKGPVALIILDGWGINESCDHNAVCQARTPCLDALLRDYPSTRLGASGGDVGLPDGQMGNSEVGQLNIGAGRIVYQDLTRISKSIADGDFARAADMHLAAADIYGQIPHLSARMLSVAWAVR